MTKSRFPSRFLALLTAAMLMLVFAGCSAPSTGAEASEPASSQQAAANTEENENGPLQKEMRTMTDPVGRQIQVPVNIERIVTLPIPLPSIIYAVDGSCEKIVGMHPTSLSPVKEGTLKDLAPELLNVSTGFVREGFTVNLEELLKLRPDVVFQWSHQPDEIEKMENAGIPVIAMKYGTQEDLERWITFLGELFNKQERADEILKFHSETTDFIVSRTKDIPEDKKPRTMYLYSEEPAIAGKDTYNHYWLEVTGGKNVAAELTGTGTAVNMEQILKWNPEIIYIGNFTKIQPDDLYNNKITGQDWSQVDAVKNRRVYKIPLAGYRWDPPNIESPLMLKWLAQIQHPDLFGDYDMTGELKSFYKKFYDYDISDEQAKALLHLEN